MVCLEALGGREEERLLQTCREMISIPLAAFPETDEARKRVEAN